MGRTPGELEKIALFADALPAAVWVGTAPQGTCVYVNRRFNQILGIEPPPEAERGNYVGPYGVHRLDGSPYPEADMPFERVMRSRASVIVDDIVIHRHDGDKTYLRVFASPIFEQDELLYVVEAFIDITPEVQARQKHAESERRVQVAQRLDAIGSLASGIAHDFNNLLASVKLVAGQLQETEIDPSRKQLIGVLDEAANSAAKLTRALLGLAQRRGPVAEVVAVGQVVQRVAELARRTFGKQFKIETELLIEGDNVEGDASQIEQIVMNLAVNARDALGSGGTLILRTLRRSVHAAERPDLSAGDYVVIEVVDNGTGMEADVAAHAFDAYVTTKSRDATKGTGLGLAIVYGIAKAHRGLAEVALSGPTGTTIRVFLAAAAEEARPAESKPRPLAPVRGRGKILIVDDEPLVLQVTDRVLRQLGYDTALAAQGDEAVSLVAADPTIDCILLDMTMPGLTLHETCAAIASKRSGLPIVLMTGASRADEAARLSAFGVRALLQKPFELAHLSSVICDALKTS